MVTVPPPVEVPSLMTSETGSPSGSDEPLRIRVWEMKTD